MCLITCSSCSRTVVTGESCYPAGTDYRNAEYRVVVVSTGARGKAYTDYGQKIVRTIVFPKTGPQTTNVFNLNVGNLDWTVNWRDSSNFTVDFFESNKSAQPRALPSVRFALDPRRKAFVVVESASDPVP
jgi:hypothetical protein